jgi:T5SS/PEP-CTERM-associated repeat protein
MRPETVVLQLTKRAYLILGFITGIFLNPRPSKAQFTADFQTNIISGVSSNWVGDYFVGHSGTALLIQNHGELFDANAVVANNAANSNDSVVVSGSGSVWSNQNLSIGIFGRHSSLVISNGGKVADITALAYVGHESSSGNNTVLITDTGSVWSVIGAFAADISVGYSGSGNSLIISNGGVLVTSSFGGGIVIGGPLSIGNNSVVITGPGSVWSNNATTIVVGNESATNRFIISNGGKLLNNAIVLGNLNGANNNTLVVTDPGSVLSNSFSVGIGGTLSSANSLVISNGGQVITWGTGSSASYIGENSSNNTARVVNGGVWQSGTMYVGHFASSNSLTVDGGTVLATNLTVGRSFSTCDNLLELDNGSVIITNAGHAGVLEIRYGQLTVAGGLLQVDNLILTNACASLVHTGGTIIAGTVVVDPNTFRIVSVTRQVNDMLITWMMAPGATNALQVTTGGVNGSYTTNGFTDIFVVTNNTTVGTVTNYLDIGAATNAPVRYYRARLVP